MPAKPDAAQAFALALGSPDADGVAVGRRLAFTIAERGAVAEQHPLRADAAAVAERQPARPLGAVALALSQPLANLAIRRRMAQLLAAARTIRRRMARLLAAGRAIRRRMAGLEERF